jgi:hypothetical protein
MSVGKTAGFGVDRVLEFKSRITYDETYIILNHHNCNRIGPWNLHDVHKLSRFPPRRTANGADHW